MSVGKYSSYTPVTFYFSKHFAKEKKNKGPLNRPHVGVRARTRAYMHRLVGALVLGLVHGIVAANDVVLSILAL